MEFRLQISINLLITENPVLPGKFKFKGTVLNPGQYNEESDADDNKSHSSALWKTFKWVQ